MTGTATLGKQAGAPEKTVTGELYSNGELVRETYSDGSEAVVVRHGNHQHRFTEMSDGQRDRLPLGPGMHQVFNDQIPT